MPVFDADATRLNPKRLRWRSAIYCWDLFMNISTGKVFLLDDGSFFVVGADGGAQGSAGFLERRCAISPETPNGTECLGAFVQRPDGKWEARISTKFDMASRSDCKILSTSSERVDAIVALWRARHEAQRQTAGG
jgi:hypothetical protein